MVKKIKAEIEEVIIPEAEDGYGSPPLGVGT
jgi:hypothetical protein